MRYGIFGGTFDPPHKGHLALALAAREHLALEEVVLVPNAKNPLRQQAFAPAPDRLDMVRLLVEDEPGLSVSDIEVARGGRSFTVDTLQDFVFVKPGQIWLLMGTDSLRGIMNWRKPETIVKLCRLGVVLREPETLGRVLSQVPEEFHEFIDEVPMAPRAVSSSKIREEMLRGVSPEMYLKPKVWAYIQERGLYTFPQPERK
ncbi:MAG: nicotinate (nicotinamide) nucleotide adenylyltransferase [Fimbriimonadaceae bacterium]|jgi:nicotinate-nucleotide adenylyltransferase|nr:nicotinate (nicotinamide) nucleotide adenylyltransferase [Fimbriimonadaceae bacterium]